MQRLLFTLLCLGLFGTVTGCTVDPARPKPAATEAGVTTYTPNPYRSTAAKDGWVYQREVRP